jgi:hypothetical protein
MPDRFAELAAALGVHVTPEPHPQLTEDVVFKSLQAAETTEVPAGDKPGLADVGRLTLRNIFRHPEAHPVVLGLLLLRRYGIDYLTWAYETLERHIPQDFGIDTISVLNGSKIQAIRTLQLVDAPWERWEVFNWTAHPCNNLLPDFHVMQVPTTAMLAVAIDTMARVREDLTFSSEVQAFMQQVMHFDGVHVAVPPYQFLAGEPVPDLLDEAAIRRGYDIARRTRVPPVDESADSEQVRRLLVIDNQVEIQRARLRSQLEILRDAPTK